MNIDDIRERLISTFMGTGTATLVVNVQDIWANFSLFFSLENKMFSSVFISVVSGLSTWTVIEIAKFCKDKIFKKTV